MIFGVYTAPSYRKTHWKNYGPRPRFALLLFPLGFAVGGDRLDPKIKDFRPGGSVEQPNSNTCHSGEPRMVTKWPQNWSTGLKQNWSTGLKVGTNRAGPLLRSYESRAPWGQSLAQKAVEIRRFPLGPHTPHPTLMRGPFLGPLVSWLHPCGSVLAQRHRSLILV